MFSSTPFQELPFFPNDFHPPNLLFDNEKDCFSFNHYDPFISDDGCFYHSSSPIKQDFVTHQQQFSKEPVLQSSGEDHCDLLDAVVSSSKSEKKPVASKKDGHSKIYTSRGLRDRRVRLSIEISQKFFCLQDLLGFDKASNTLDWLITKSKSAIRELIDESNRGSSSTVDDQSKADFLESIEGDEEEDKGKFKKKCVDVKKKKMMSKSIAKFQEINHVRDQSRTMARARARQRTTEKMNLKKINDCFDCWISNRTVK